MNVPLHIQLDHFKDFFLFFYSFGFVCFRRTKEQKNGGIGPQPEKQNEIVIQQASDGCQAVLHCRCDANIHSSAASPSLSIFTFLSVLSLFLVCQLFSHTVHPSGHFSFYIFFFFFSFLPSHFSVGAPLLLLSILSVEMSGRREAVCPAECCAIRLSDGVDCKCASCVCLCVCACEGITKKINIILHAGSEKLIVWI